MKIRYGWIPEYSDPHYWDARTPLWISVPKVVNFYFDLNDNKVRNFLRKQKGRILDAGCGSGRFLNYADVGVDFSKAMLRKAKRIRKSLVLASILHLPFRDKAFAVAFTVDVLLHIKPEKRNEAVKELHRVAKAIYNFLAEQRTTMPFIMQHLKILPFKPRKLIPYIALFLTFPFDRLRKLKINRISLLDENKYESASYQ